MKCSAPTSSTYPPSASGVPIPLAPETASESSDPGPGTRSGPLTLGGSPTTSSTTPRESLSMAAWRSAAAA
jgi:hypothetical protein